MAAPLKFSASDSWLCDKFSSLEIKDVDRSQVDKWTIYTSRVVGGWFGRYLLPMLCVRVPRSYSSHEDPLTLFGTMKLDKTYSDVAT